MSTPMYYDLAVKFIIGSAGASTILYSGIGGELPGMGKSITIQNQNDMIKELEDDVKQINEDLARFRNQLDEDGISVEKFEALDKSYGDERNDNNLKIQELRDSVSKLSRQTNLQGAIFFVLLGGFFAALLTGGTLLEGDALNLQTLLSAVAMGAGWTGVISRLEQASAKDDLLLDRNKRIDEVTEKYEKGVSELINEKNRLTENIATYKDRIAVYKNIVEEFKEILS